MAVVCGGGEPATSPSPDCASREDSLLPCAAAGSPAYTALPSPLLPSAEVMEHKNNKGVKRKKKNLGKINIINI
jgi:hypothetical protein